MSTNMPPSSVNSHFYHIPKTGGRSIISAFGKLNYPNMNLSTEDMYGFIVDTIKSCGTTDSSSLYIDGFNGITFGSKFLTFGHIPYHKVFSEIESHENKISSWSNQGVTIVGFPSPSREQMESCCSFTVVRDPISRMFSYYKEYLEELSRDVSFLVSRGCVFKNVTTSIHELSPKSDSELSERKEWTFEVKALPNERKLEQVYYFSKTFDINEAIENIEKLSSVVICEKNKKGISSISKHIGLDLKVSHGFSRNSSYKVSKREMEFARKELALEYDFYKVLYERYA